MRTQEHSLWIVLAVILMGSFILLLSVPMVNAIGQETPTPPPFQPTLAPAQATRPAPISTASVPVLTATAPVGDFTRELADAQSALSTGDYTTAVDVTSQVLIQSPYNYDALTIRAQAYTYNGFYDRAIADYDDLIRQQGWDWELYRLRGRVYSYLGDYNNAIRDLSTAIDIYPYSADSFYERGDYYYYNAQYDASDLDYQYADAMFSNDIGAFVAIAEQAKTLDPHIVSFAYTEIGSIELSNGNYDSAIEYLDEALKLSPDLGGAYLTRGLAYYEKGNAVQAGFDFLGRIQNTQTQLKELSLIVGEPYTLTMSYGMVYLMRWDVNAGDKFDIVIEGTDAVDPLAVILKANGEALYGVDDNYNSFDIFLDDFEFTEGGNYTLVISHAGGGWTGSVNLTVTKVN